MIFDACAWNMPGTVRKKQESLMQCIKNGLGWELQHCVPKYTSADGMLLSLVKMYFPVEQREQAIAFVVLSRDRSRVVSFCFQMKE